MDKDASCLTPNNFNIRCSHTFLGHDMKDGFLATRSLVECLETCKNREGCIAVAFKPKRASSLEKNCQLKDGFSVGVENGEIIGEPRFSPCVDVGLMFRRCVSDRGETREAPLEEVSARRRGSQRLSLLMLANRSRMKYEVRQVDSTYVLFIYHSLCYAN